MPRPRRPKLPSLCAGANEQPLLPLPPLPPDISGLSPEPMTLMSGAGAGQAHDPLLQDGSEWSAQVMSAHGVPSGCGVPVQVPDAVQASAWMQELPVVQTLPVAD